jgi:hypothetical protein
MDYRPLAFVGGEYTGIAVPDLDADFMVARDKRFNEHSSLIPSNSSALSLC